MSGAIKLDFKLAGKHVGFSMWTDTTCVADQAMLFALRHGGCVEPEVSHLLARTLRPGDYAIDGGANVGFFTILMSKLVGPDGFVLAFEPGPNNLYKLKENINLNKCKNIEIVAKPLSDKHETLQFFLCQDGSKNSLAPHLDTRGNTLLEAAVLDDYATEDICRKLRLIKLDIEGAELLAMQGGMQLLGEEGCPYIVMELNNEALPKFKASFESVRDFMREQGYDMFLLHESGVLPTYVPRHTKVLPNRLNWNVLFSTLDMVGAAWPETEL